MKKSDIIALCRYYKGETQNPFENKDQNKTLLWIYEQIWLEDMQNDNCTFTDLLTDYLDAGLRDFCKTDDTPITLKALLFNRFCKMQDRTDPEAFKEFYQKYYS